MGSINDDHNIIGLSHLMKDEKVNPEINIEELERTIINGEKDIQVEEVDLVNQYKSELARLSHQFGVELSSDDGRISDKIIRNSGGADSWISQQSSRFTESSSHDSDDDQEDTSRDSYKPSGLGNRDSSLRASLNFGGGSRSSDYDNPRESANDRYGTGGREGINIGELNDYKFQSEGPARYSKGQGLDQDDFMDPYAQNMTQEQQKRRQLQHVFNNISSNDRVPMNNYDLMADREYEDKQMLLAAIDDLRDDLQQIGVDISRVKEVDNSSSMAEIREVYNKLIYKNNSNNYSNFADELFLLGAQAAEFLFDGEKEWFGHKPDLTGWSNTVRGKLRRMRYTKTQIVRKVVDDYQIPPWLQIGFEIIPSAFTHSRHRKTAVRDSVVNNATYQNAIHDLNNIMS
jgi:hypothetical protein